MSTHFQQHKYDVIIIGAGVAGASAAYELAQNGADVLVVEKEKLPRYYYPLSLVAISGVFLMYYPTVSGLSGSLVDDLGVQAAFLGLLAAALWGSGTVLGKYLLVHSDTETP